MEYELAYKFINLGVLPAWLLLWFLPKSRVTEVIVHSGFYPLLFGTVYTIFLVRGIFFGAAAEGAGMSDAASVAAFFSHPNGVLVGWVHYLVFDLFVGAWIGRDAERHGFAWYIRIPSQLFTFVFGPVGLLIYMIIRKLKGVGLALNENQASA